jgi:hypothetical protein
MNKRQQPDEVIEELWAVKDSTAERYSTVGDYLAHLKKSAVAKKNKTPVRTDNRAPPVKSRTAAARRKTG